MGAAEILFANDLLAASYSSGFGPASACCNGAGLAASTIAYLHPGGEEALCAWPRLYPTPTARQPPTFHTPPTVRFAG